MTMAATQNPMKRWKISWQALERLAGCPDGATEPMMESKGFPAIALRQLVADGFAWSVLRTFANPKGLTVTHYHITDAGKAALASRRERHDD